MPLKKSVGNMYDWVTYTHSHLGGECPHKCVYCYVQRNRFGVPARYQGEPRLIEKELSVNYGSGKTIFIEHMNDLFAECINPIKGKWISMIFNHIAEYPNNKYVFQTKNPSNAFQFVGMGAFPRDYMIGTTIETNRDSFDISKAPLPKWRAEGIKDFSDYGIKTFITIEPILDFDFDKFVNMIIDAKPSFINIGADSKHCNLLEPSSQKLRDFIVALRAMNITIRKKSNLGRLLKEV